MFQEALNNMVNCFSRQFELNKMHLLQQFTGESTHFKQDNSCYFTFALDDYFIRNPLIRDELFSQFIKIENYLVIESFNSSHFDNLSGTSKIMVTDILCKCIKFEEKDIDCAMLGNTCHFCTNKEYTSMQLNCDDCPTEINILEIKSSMFEAIFEAHKNYCIFYDYFNCD